MSAATWSDGRTGLCGLPEPGPGPWPLAEVVHRFRARVHLPDRVVTVAGAALSADAARSACLGEAVERYAALVPRAPDFVATRSRLADAGREHLCPAGLGATPAPGPDDEGEWVVATDGRLVPLAAARGSLVGASSYPQGSTGLAAAATVESAVRAGSAEVVERDTVSRAWSAGALCAVRPDRVLPALLRRATRDAGLEVVVHLLPTGCPSSVVALVALRDPRTGLLGAGAAYRPDVTVAVTKAWTEAVVSIAQAAELADPVVGPALCADAGLAPWRADRRYASGGWAGITDLTIHAQLLLDPDLADRVWTRLAGRPAAPVPLRRCRPPVDLVTSLFDDVVVVDLSTPDVRAAAGPAVVRVLAVGADTVRPAGTRPEELPCPLI